MRLLFIHQAFPGQFLHAITGLLARGHEVHAIGAGEAAFVPEGCHYHTYAVVQAQQLPAGLCDPGLELCLIRGERVAALARALAQQGFDPAVIVFHSGWGEGLYLREIWPQALLITYPELYGTPSLLETSDPDAPPLDIGRRQLLQRNNLVSLAALANADVALSPTLFQRNTFPAPWRSRFQIIHEGIDTERIKPNHQQVFRLPGGRVLGSADLVLTYVSRSLEPLRGFCRFMRALPELLDRHPSLQVVIVGADDPSYSPPSSHPGGYRGAMLEVLGAAIDRDRVHFLGLLQRQQLTALLQVSSVHAYLTYPYTVSWSLLEAMACAAVVVGSDTEAVRDVIRHGANGLLVPLDDTAAITAGLDAVLRDPAAHAHLGLAARETVLRRFERQQSVAMFCDWINSLLVQRSIR
ncbi:MULTISPECIES: glycosyltransferase [unclassified Synechococcus]|uniref:glycosyltransferase n=1 Tax=unclassified Synechococcus TaxID=2626047 RepID=UPI0000698F5B|nr:MULTISPECIES: glycosyltransferase [unclassified Synechococcus]EAQ74129.1 probable glycosyltransferase [Synechococcus sp. WH 5701]WFN58394.1 glycosyltransferase [Synechococcus sp. CCFWC 502]